MYLYHSSDSSNEGFLEEIKVGWALFFKNLERRQNLLKRYFKNNHCELPPDLIYLRDGLGIRDFKSSLVTSPCGHIQNHCSAELCNGQSPATEGQELLFLPYFPQSKWAFGECLRVAEKLMSCGVFSRCSVEKVEKQ